MSKTNKYDSEFIERYLLDKVSEEEKAAFQFQLMRNPKLKGEVNDMRRLQKTVIAASRTKNDGGSRIKKLRWLWPLLLVGGIGIGYLLGIFNKETNTPKSKQEEKMNQPSLKPENNSSTETKTDETNPINNTTTTEPTPKKKKDSTIKKKRPMAIADPADLIPNAYFETLMSGVRGSDFELEIRVPKENAKYHLTKGIIKFGFQATLKTAKVPDLTFSVYDNKEGSYENETTVYSQKLDILSDHNQYTIQIATPLQLKRGLYYYVLEGEEDFFGLGKFTVQ